MIDDYLFGADGILRVEENGEPLSPDNAEATRQDGFLFGEIPPEPCISCANKEECQQKKACEAFLFYVQGAETTQKNNQYPTADRTPRSDIYQLIFRD
ncbi:hypothetical protein GCM10023116_01710 [Kistimonas scapharcae]|uniref:Uncharacterized protein n=1 Tax=Kistimonas scapharcae TaxID=1036133 RepID=A0ABP8UXR8_9GAMM